MAKTTVANKLTDQLRYEVFDNLAEMFKLKPSELQRWAFRTQQTLLLLTQSTYRDEEKEFYQQTESYSNMIELLLKHPDKLEPIIGKGGIRILSEGLEKVIGRANEAISAQISEPEIGLFCLLAEGGRDMFEQENQDPDVFVPQDIFALAKLIRENYPAYEETLQGLRA